MVNARNFLDARQQEQVREAVCAAEKRTSAEIVCALASESGRYDRAESILGLVLGLLGLALVQHVYTLDAGWAPVSAPTWALSGGVVLGFVLGNLIGTFLPLLRMPFVFPGEAEEEVARAASHVFSVKRCGSTRGAGGVLIYVSLSERRVVILADRGALEAIGQAGVDELRDLALSRLKQGKRLEALTETITRAGDLLAEKLPIQPGDEQELPDELVLIHPRP